jgi:hypothetical protein
MKITVKKHIIEEFVKRREAAGNDITAPGMFGGKKLDLNTLLVALSLHNSADIELDTSLDYDLAVIRALHEDQNGSI